MCLNLLIYLKNRDDNDSHKDSVMLSKLTTFLFAINGLFSTVEKLPGEI